MKPMLAEKYEGQNPSGWLMSEKFDGIRAIWDGESLKSRSGKTFSAPNWFIETLPKGVILDGELWEGRGLFQKTVGKVRAKEGDWSRIIFMMFDFVDSTPFARRIETLHALDIPDHCQLVKHVRCQNRAHLDKYEAELLNGGAEGVMLRNPTSKYQYNRSQDLLKVKKVRTDEAIVIGHTKGLGRVAGSVGALICEWAGKKFKIGTGLDDIMRLNAPNIGVAITFSYFGTTDGGVPRFPVFIGVRDYE